MLNSFASSESFEQRIAEVYDTVFLLDERSTIIFWAEFQLDHFEEWSSPDMSKSSLE